MRATILLWSAVSGVVLGLFTGAVTFAAVAVAGELLPAAGATLGWLEGRLKLR